MKKLTEYAKVIRSKNSSPFELTFDIIFNEDKHYRIFKEQKLITRESVAQLYDVPVERVSKVIFFDPAKAVKFGMRRSVPSGAPGDTDVYGAQQHGPLLTLEYNL